MVMWRLCAAGVVVLGLVMPVLSDSELSDVRRSTLQLGRKLQSLTEGLAAVVRDLRERAASPPESKALNTQVKELKTESDAAAKELKNEIQKELDSLEQEHIENYKSLEKLIKELPAACGGGGPPVPEHPIGGGPGGDYGASYQRDTGMGAMGPPPPDPCAEEDGEENVANCRREEIRKAFKHSWDGYRKYAWGQDELMPLSRRGKNWGKGSLSMGLTMLDAISTLWIMDFKEEFHDVRNWVKDEMQTDLDMSVSTFETTIRVVGGLLSAYELSGEKHPEFLNKARDIADRLLFAYNTSSGIPHAQVNLRTHYHSNPHWTGGSSVLSEFGTVQLELRTLSYHLGDSKYDQKATWIMDVIEGKAPPDFLCPTYYNTVFNRWTSDHITLGALGDSFYEYLLKQYLLTGKTEKRYHDMYKKAVKGILSRLVKKTNPGGAVYVAEFKRGAVFNKMDHLACFAGGMLALGVNEIGHDGGADNDEVLNVAEGLTETCYQMYKQQPTGVAPELVEFRGGGEMSMSGRAGYYLLRPEAVESFMYLWRVTKKKKYREWGWEVFRAINRWCKVDSGGFSGLRNVGFVPPQKDDLQQSFWLAETLKYLYILFAEDDAFDFGAWVLNTEAHPLKIRRRDPFEVWTSEQMERRGREEEASIDERLTSYRESFERRQLREGVDGMGGAGGDDSAAAEAQARADAERNRLEERMRQEHTHQLDMQRRAREEAEQRHRQRSRYDPRDDSEQARLERLEQHLALRNP
eukprot:Hpha_TRINITY_DN13247_c1_g1::TRINITY_DN13247_c1_g1_i1::g.154806::m.154806/K01230/MAN1; mannosyl-oligosaccharide alpha-1,2-mannosidase